MANTWFEVDKEGLRKLLGEREKHFALFELVQNAWDTNATKVDITLEPIPGSHRAKLTVEDDDPNGFVFIEHAYTLFAESVKKTDPEKRGRFNLGEKLVLALCHSAEVISTKGHVIFNSDGTRQLKRDKRDKGSLFRADIKMSREEIKEAVEQLKRLIPRKDVATSVNGEKITFQREHIASFTATLPTVIANSEGVLTRSRRQTGVHIYKPRSGESAAIYEMGIPVVETTDTFIVDVLQKVPLNMNRDNVPPSYAKQLRSLVLNATSAQLSKAQAESDWVTEALGGAEVSGGAVTKVMDLRFGTNRATFDPSDMEATTRLTAEGYAIVSGGTFNKRAWQNIKKANAVQPAGVIRPTPKPYTNDPNAPRLEVVPEKDYNPAMHKVVALAKRLGKELMNAKNLHVRIVKAPNFQACYRKGHLDISLSTLGNKWFAQESTNRAQIFDLLLHEFAHHYASNHFSDEYFGALSKLGGKLADLAARNPKIVLE